MVSSYVLRLEQQIYTTQYNNTLKQQHLCLKAKQNINKRLQLRSKQNKDEKDKQPSKGDNKIEQTDIYQQIRSTEFDINKKQSEGLKQVVDIGKVWEEQNQVNMDQALSPEELTKLQDKAKISPRVQLEAIYQGQKLQFTGNADQPADFLKEVFKQGSQQQVEEKEQVLVDDKPLQAPDIEIQDKSSTSLRLQAALKYKQLKNQASEKNKSQVQVSIENKYENIQSMPQVKIISVDKNYDPFASLKQDITNEKTQSQQKEYTQNQQYQQDLDKAQTPINKQTNQNKDDIENNSINIQEGQRSTSGEIVKDYTPKVSTWGVFPRPKNISKSYGGGRTIKQGGEQLWTDEEVEQKRRKLKESVHEYLLMSGKVVDLSQEKECQEQYDKGMKLFNKGNTYESLAYFDNACSKLHFKTEFGGLALLQKAICLDSMGKNAEALPLYRNLLGHSNDKVAKRAKMFVYGFKAATFLKADQFSYQIKKDEYLNYFTKVESLYNNSFNQTKTYTASTSMNFEPQVEDRIYTILALSIVAAPLLTVAGIILRAKV